MFRAIVVICVAIILSPIAMAILYAIDIFGNGFPALLSTVLSLAFYFLGGIALLLNLFFPTLVNVKYGDKSAEKARVAVFIVSGLLVLKYIAICIMGVYIAISEDTSVGNDWFLFGIAGVFISLGLCAWHGYWIFLRGLFNFLDK